MSDSSTGGILAPIQTGPGPLVGQALFDFLQAWIVGLTGLPGVFVRMEDQPEPPIIPDASVAWCSLSIAKRVGDTFPFIGHDGGKNGGNGLDQIIRNEELDLLCSFYGLGAGGLADEYAELMRDGALIAQNRAYLQAQNFDLGYVGDLTSVPTLVKNRWLYRVDLPIMIRRQVVRQYPVLNVLSIGGSVTTDSGVTVQLSGP